jgi:hypothetical protein
MKKLVALTAAAVIAVSLTACNSGKTDPNCHAPKDENCPADYETDHSYEDILTYVNDSYTVLYSPEGDSIAFAYPLFHEYGDEEMEAIYSGEDGSLIGRHLTSFDSNSYSTDFTLYDTNSENIMWENSIYTDKRYFSMNAYLDFEPGEFSREEYLKEKADIYKSTLTEEEKENCDVYGPFSLRINDSMADTMCMEIFRQMDTVAQKEVFAVHYVGDWGTTPVYMKIHTVEMQDGDYKTAKFFDTDIINAAVAGVELSDAKG